MEGLWLQLFSGIAPTVQCYCSNCSVVLLQLFSVIAPTVQWYCSNCSVVLLQLFSVIAPTVQWYCFNCIVFCTQVRYTEQLEQLLLQGKSARALLPCNKNCSLLKLTRTVLHSLKNRLPLPRPGLGLRVSVPHTSSYSNYYGLCLLAQLAIRLFLEVVACILLLHAAARLQG